MARQQPMSIDEFLEWQRMPENIDRMFELIDGVVKGYEYPSVHNGVVCGKVGFQLQSYVRDRRKGIAASNNPQVLISEQPATILAPDLLLFAKTLSEYDMGEESFKTRRKPTLVVEVLDGLEERGPMATKACDYLNSGVAMVWIVDPKERTIAVFRRDAESRQLGVADTLSGEGILPDLSIPVAEIFKIRGQK